MIPTNMIALPQNAVTVIAAVTVKAKRAAVIARRGVGGLVTKMCWAPGSRVWPSRRVGPCATHHHEISPFSNIWRRPGLGPHVTVEKHRVIKIKRSSRSFAIRL